MAFAIASGVPPQAGLYCAIVTGLVIATDKFAEILDELDTLPPIVVLRLRNMTAIDNLRSL